VRGDFAVIASQTRGRLLRAAHTAKRPARCPHCGGRRLMRKGQRRKKFELVQLWQCASCRRVFTPAPGDLRNKTYPLRLILDGLTLYNLGHSLAQSAARLKSRHGKRIAVSTLAAWVNEHKSLTTYQRLRPKGKRHYPAQQAIRTVKLYHRQVYHFAYHRPKLALLSASREHGRFAPLADFLQALPQLCPHELFRDSSRASQLGTGFVDLSRLMVISKENFATRMAALVLPTLGDNRLRHQALQRFMLANDSVTLAVEVPIWLTPSDITQLERRHHIRLLPARSRGQSITGHIDFLQVRNGAVHILDYKPDARTNRPIAQLTLYALALSQLIGIRLFDIKCAWFNEDEYCEFFPRKILFKDR
jgi:transposase-like protein